MAVSDLIIGEHTTADRQLQTDGRTDGHRARQSTVPDLAPGRRDLIIGAVSMPSYTVYLLAGQRWVLGQLFCDLWLSLDYTVRPSDSSLRSGRTG